MSVRKAATSIFGRAALATGVTLMLAPSAFADKSKTVGELLKRIESNTKKVQFSKTNIALPSVQKTPGAHAPGKENFQSIKPPVRKQIMFEEGTNEAELEAVTDKQIDQLYKLTRQFKTSSRRGELWLRLAEAYVDKSKLIEYKIQTEHDQKTRAFAEGKGPRPGKLDLKPSQEYNAKAVELYQWFLRDFPKDPKADQALYFVGYNLFELGKEDQGKQFYERLVKEHPGSPYIEESNFALGEYSFDHEKWKDALKHYDEVARNKHGRLAGFALYKRAWCEYKIGDIKNALASLEQVIRSGRQAKGDHNSGGVSRIRMAGEAQKDLVIFYAEGGDPKKARAYFEDVVGGKAVFPMMESLAYHYVDIGNREAARETFKSLIAERPTAAKSFDYQYRIVTMYAGETKNDSFKAELFAWIDGFGPGSDWYRTNQGNSELTSKSMALIETTLRNNILQNHQSAQNSHSQIAQKQAKDGYEIYFKTFKDGARLDEMHFFYAELLFDMGDFEHAAGHYDWVATHAQSSKYYEKSALNAVLAYEKKLPKEEELKKKVDKENLTPIELEPNVKAFQLAAERYIAAFPKGENVPAMRYKLGVLYYYHNQFDEALNSFNSIIKDYPKSSYAKYAANLTLDIYNLKKDYAGLEQAGESIMKNPDLAKSEVGDQVKGVIQQVQFKKAQALEEKKDYAGAAKAFEDFGKASPGSDLGVSANYNAGVDYERAGQPGKALGMYTLVMAAKSSTHENLKKNAHKFSIGLYEKAGQYEKAAKAFEDFAKADPKDKEAVNYYFNAAIIRDGMNNYTAANGDYEEYMSKSHAADKKEALFLIAKMYERRGNSTKALEYFQKYHDTSPANASALIEASFACADIYAKKKNLKDAEKWYQRTISLQKRLSKSDKPVGGNFAAEAKFHLIYKTFEELRAMKIPADPKKAEKIIKDKLSKITQLQNELKSVIAYDNPEMIVASLTLQGQAWQHLAAAVQAVPPPKGYSADDLKVYRAGIEKYVHPWVDNAVKNYETAVQRGFELEGYNDWLRSAQKELAALDRDKHADFGEKTMITKAIDSMDKSEPKDDEGVVASSQKTLGDDPKNLGALNALAVHYYNQGKYGLAKIIIQRALADYKEIPTLHNNIGVIFMSEGKQRQAIGSYKKAMELKSSYPIAAANLGSIYADYHDYKKAVDLLGVAYDVLKSDLGRGHGIEVATNYAVALGGAGEIDHARDVYKKIMKANDSNPSALYNYAVLLIARMKEKKEGEKILGKLKTLGDSSLQRKVEELEKMLTGI